MLLSIPPRPSSRPRLIPGLSLRSGDLLAGRYRALSLLRADRACAHIAATQSGTHARLEVQILLATDDAVEPIMLRFLADARKAATLAGPHVERIHHVGVTEDGHPFVVRDPASSGTLAALLGKLGSLPTEAAVDVAIALCKALDSAHAVGLFHGEIDANVVQLRYGSEGPSEVKLAGLGTSRALAMLPFETRPLASGAARAPEQLVSDAAPLDARADVWSVGVLLYTMLAGAPPFATDTPSKLDVTAAGEEPALLAGVPDGLAEIVDACLSRDPSQRPQTAASLAARLALYGERPVFEKRASLLVVDTGRYEAQVLEQLVKDAAPSEQWMDVEMDPPSSPTPTLAAADHTPVPSVVTRSAPPVAITVAPPAPAPISAKAQVDARAPSSPRNWRATAFAAAACVGIGAIAIAFATRGHAPAAAPAAAAQAAEAPPAAKNLPPILPAQAQPATAPDAPRPMAISDLPSAPAAAPVQPRPAASSGAKPKAKGAAAPGAEPAAAADPLVHSASAPIQPQPKASDDDLRRFLDDRR